MREIGTPKIGLHITNSHIKRPRITVNQRIGSRKEAISGSHIREIAVKKTAYNEGCLYMNIYIFFVIAKLNSKKSYVVTGKKQFGRIGF